MLPGEVAAIGATPPPTQLLFYLPKPIPLFNREWLRAAAVPLLLADPEGAGAK